MQATSLLAGMDVNFDSQLHWDLESRYENILSMQIVSVATKYNCSINCG